MKTESTEYKKDTRRSSDWNTLTKKSLETVFTDTNYTTHKTKKMNFYRPSTATRKLKQYLLIFVILYTNLLTTCVSSEYAHHGRDSSASAQVVLRKPKKQKDKDHGSNLMITKDIYINTWAVRVVGDDSMARKVASENGFIFKGKVKDFICLATNSLIKNPFYSNVIFWE